MNIAIITPGGLTNFGERAIMLGTVYALRERFPKATIAIFGYQDLPQEDPKLHTELRALGAQFYPPIIRGRSRLAKLLLTVGIATWPRLFLPAKSYRFLKNAEVYAKGQESLTQDYGLVHFVDSVLEPLLVRRITTRVVLFGHSIGPVYKHRWWAAWAVKRFAKIYVRDSRSEATLRQLGYDPTRIERIKDLAFTAVPQYAPATKTDQTGHYLLVPNAAICTTPRRTEQYLQNVRRIIETLLDEGKEVIIGSSVTATDWNGDYRLCELLKSEYNQLKLKEYRELHEFLADVRHARQVISSRLHPLIMATGLGTAIVALSRSHKVSGLLGDLGLQTALVDPFTAIKPEQLRSL